MDDRDELSVRRAAQTDRRDLDAHLREELLEGQRGPSVAALQRRVESASRARTTARNVVAVLERRAREGDAAAIARLPAAIDRAAAAGDRLMAALDRRSAAELLLRSTQDELTGALQRAAGLQQLERELARSRREQSPLVVAFVDVDGLKAVNDSLGHLAGDDVMRSVGRALSRHVRGYDVLFRFGGDEFVVGLCGVDLDGAQERFRSMIDDLDRLAPGRTFSVGFALARPEDLVIDLLARADADLYARRLIERAADVTGQNQDGG